MSTLYIFDFDDTLIHSDSQVYISHADGSESKLSSDQYATYDELPGDEMDFSDFDSYPRNAKIIESVFSELLFAIGKAGKGSVVILTARSDPRPVIAFLKDNGVSGIEVHATGSSDPRKKAEYVVSRLSEENIDFIKVYEDNVRNIREIRKVVKDTGDTGLQSHRIVNGRIASVRNLYPKK